MQDLRGRINGWVENVSPLKFFIITAAVFGLFFILITPPFQGADEIVHFYRAYQVSEGNLVADKTKGRVGGELPKSLGEVVAITNTPIIKFYPQNKYNIHLTKTALSKDIDNKKKKFYDFPDSAAYSPSAYIFSAPSMLFARLIHMPTLVMFYAGRLGDLLGWIILMGAAIYFIPSRKWVLVAVALIPMAVFQASTINGDSVTIGSLALLFSLILYYSQKKIVLRKKHIFLLLATSILLVLSKEIMFIFLPLVFLLKGYNFNSQNFTNFKKIALLVAPIFFFLVWLFIIKENLSVTSYSNHQNPSAQLDFISRSPFSYINVLWNTYFYSWGDGVTRSFIGVFGWSDAPLSELITVVGYVGLGALFFANRGGSFLLSKRDKILLWSTIALYWLAVSTSLYLYFSPVGYKIIYGLQGRYYLPIALMAIPLLASKKVNISQDLYKRIAVLLPLFLLISSGITVYVRYFVSNV